MIFRSIYYKLPLKLRFLVRRLIYAPYDLFQKEQYENGLRVPPKAWIFTGSGNFKETGLRFLGYFKGYGLRSTHRFLDIGSGIGRIALPLTSYLEGKYVGLDIVELGVRWCQKNISKYYPHFEFKLLDVKNDLYTNEGQDAADIRLPLPNQSFDFACLISVFTHMLPSEVENYLNELARCLVEGAICCATFFIYSSEEELLDNEFRPFIKKDDRHALMDEKVKAANVAYSWTYLSQMLENYGFEVIDFHVGKWRDSKRDHDFQDLLILKNHNNGKAS